MRKYLLILLIIFLLGCEKTITFTKLENMKEGEIILKTWTVRNNNKPNEEYYFVIIRLNKEKYESFKTSPEKFHFYKTLPVVLKENEVIE